MADAMDVSVFGARYLYAEIRGMLMGFAGAYLPLTCTAGWTRSLTVDRGWVVFALVNFAIRDSLRAVVDALLFGGVEAIQPGSHALETTIPASLLNMLPYILTVVILALVTWRDGLGKRTSAPLAPGCRIIAKNAIVLSETGHEFPAIDFESSVATQESNLEQK